MRKLVLLDWPILFAKKDPSKSHDTTQSTSHENIPLQPNTSNNTSSEQTQNASTKNMNEIINSKTETNSPLEPIIPKSQTQQNDYSQNSKESIDSVELNNGIFNIKRSSPVEVSLSNISLPQKRVISLNDEKENSPFDKPECKKPAMRDNENIDKCNLNPIDSFSDDSLKNGKSNDVQPKNTNTITGTNLNDQLDDIPKSLDDIVEVKPSTVCPFHICFILFFFVYFKEILKFFSQS